MEIFMPVGVLLLIEFIVLIKLKINFYKQYMKEKNGKLQTAEIKEWKECFFTRPPIYVLKFTFVENNKKKNKTIASSSFYLRKYKNKKYIRIVTVPGTDFLFFNEEKWLLQNICLIIIGTILSVIMLPLCIFGIIGFVLKSVIHMLLFLFILVVVIYMRKKRCAQGFIKHKSRMVYNTKLSCEEILESLKQQTDNNFQFQKESENSKDKVYILSVNIIPFYIKKMRITARYRVLMTPSQEGSSVWIYLFECSNSYMLHKFSGRVGKYLQKKIQAFRVE